MSKNKMNVGNMVLAAIVLLAVAYVVAIALGVDS